MPRPCQRVRLESGLKLDLNRLARRGFIQPGAHTGSGINWKNNYTDEQTASGFITADMSGSVQGWFRIQIGNLDQRITLISRPRYFGGRQWYFICPYLNRPASVVWRWRQRPSADGLLPPRLLSQATSPSTPCIICKIQPNIDKIQPYRESCM